MAGNAECSAVSTFKSYKSKELELPLPSFGLNLVSAHFPSAV